MKPQNILIDTDVDDVLALAFALLRPKLSVKAIITTAFNSDKRNNDKRARMVGKLLEIMGREEVPFAPGLNFPLRSIAPSEMAKLTEVGGYKLHHASWADDEIRKKLPDIFDCPKRAEGARSLRGRLSFEPASPSGQVAD